MAPSMILYIARASTTVLPTSMTLYGTRECWPARGCAFTPCPTRQSVSSGLERENSRLVSYAGLDALIVGRDQCGQEGQAGREAGREAGEGASARAGNDGGRGIAL